MSNSQDEHATCPQRSDLAELAAGLLGRSGAKTQESDGIHAGLDCVSQLRYRDTNRSGEEHGDHGLPHGQSSTFAGEDPTMARHVDLGAQLRQAIKRSNITRYEIAKRAELSYAVVHGFVAGTSDLRLSTASKIAEIVDVELRSRDARRR